MDTHGLVTRLIVDMSKRPLHDGKPRKLDLELLGHIVGHLEPPIAVYPR